MTDNANANVNANSQAPAHGGENKAAPDNQNKQPLNLDLNKQPEDKNVQKPDDKVQNKDDKDKSKDNKAEPVQFEKVGYAGIDFALDYVAKLGYQPDSEALNQAYLGNFDLIEAELATNPNATGYEKVLELAKRDFKDLVQKQKEKIVKLEESALKVFNGDEGKLMDVLDFARSNAEQEEKDIINRMLNSSPLEAEMAMTFLKLAYEQAKGTTISPREASRTNIQQAPSSYALSPREYANAVSELFARDGYVDGNPEYAKLQARRKAYRG